MDSVFETNGFLLVKNLWDPSELKRPVPERKGYYKYKSDGFSWKPVEPQVIGSTSTYCYPKYREIHSGLRVKVEDLIGSKLHDTYYFDRFYFPGQKLKEHTDRPACEISVSIHIDTNLECDWPLWVRTPEGKDCPVVMKPGDGVLYKGCERPHWRDPLPGDTGHYFHQAFFHYVLQNGPRAKYAGDVL